MASGTETSGSDVDLLVVGTVKMTDLVPQLEDASGTLRRQINPSLYSPGEFSKKAGVSHFIQSVLGKPLLFVKGMKGDLETITGRTPRRNRASEPSRN
jgi:hypothetical protein